MKRTVFVSSLLVCLLTLSLMFVSCDNAKDETIPHLTDFITLTLSDTNPWTPKTTFTTSDQINVGIKGTDSDLNITKFVFKLKKEDGTVIADNQERMININYSPFTQYIGYFTLAKGNYVIEPESVLKFYVYNNLRNFTSAER